MAASDDFRKNFDEMISKQKQINAGAKKLEASLAAQIDMQKDILAVKQDINNTQQRINELKELEKKALNDEKVKLKEIEEEKKKGAKTDKKRLEILKKELVAVQKIKIEKGEKIALGEHELEQQEKGLANMRQMVKESNKLKSIGRSAVNFTKAWGWDNLKKYGIFDMDKAIRNTARSMGVAGPAFKTMSNNLQDAGLATQSMGVGITKLAEMQGSYSKEIGRSVMLTKEGLSAMAELSQGTGLGEQFAVGMASAMDDFGASVETSRDLVEETMNIANSQGVNAAKAAESMQKNLKFANKYNFKNGVKGLAMMTSDALRLKLDLDGIAGLADKVFRPEGAIELSAKLSTMGGAFAQMANPMQLMNKARTDFKGFAKDIGKATAEFVEYNKENGTFDLKGGLAADRMREIANMTGLGVEELKKMATAQQRIKMIGSASPINIPEKDKAMVESFSKIGKDGKIEINVGNIPKDLKDLTKNDLELLRKKDISLKKSAEDSRTALDIFDDIQKQLQGLLLPLAQGLRTAVEPLQEMMKDAQKEGGLVDVMKNFVRNIGDIGGVLKKYLVKPVTMLAEWGGAKGVLAGIIGFKLGTWLLRGITLGKGFNMTARAGGGGTGGGPGVGGGGTGGVMNKADRRFARSQVFGKGGGSFKDRLGYAKTGFRGRQMSSGAKMAAGAGLGLAGMGLGMARGQMEDPDSTGGKMLGIGSSALSGAAMGMMLGPVGAAVGGGLGALFGAYNEYFSPDAIEKKASSEAKKLGGRKTDTYKMNDGVIQFNPNDKFMTMNDGVIAASTQQGQLDKLGKSVKTENINHKFDDIKITININAKGIDEKIAKMLVDNTSFIRSLNTKIKEEASMVLSGGILSPTTSYA